jgi:hypothetical protein
MLDNYLTTLVIVSLVLLIEKRFVLINKQSKHGNRLFFVVEIRA